MTDQNLPILALSSQASDDRIANVRFTIEVSDTKQLGALMNQLRNVEGVYDIYRVTS